MNMRKITSMTLLLSLVVLILNSVVLYIVPEGRVAYWADWRFWGLTKSQWADQHVTIGFLFLAAGFLHIYYNWNPILAYMKNKAREIRVFSGAFNVALVLTAIFVIGTYYSLPPMSVILHIGESFKEAGAKKYGEPPYGHAELSTLKMLAKKENFDLEKSLDLLKTAGLTVADGKETIKDIARRHNLTPQQVYEIIKPAKRDAEAIKASGRGIGFPDAPAPGWGKKTLAAFCQEYKLDLEQIINKLADQGIKVEGARSIKENASVNGKEPMELFEALHAIVTTSGQ